MAYEVWDYCKINSDLSTETKEFIDDCFFQLNFFSWVVDEFFDGRSESGKSLKKHFNGSVKPKIKVVSTNAEWLAHAWPDGIGSGTVVFNSAYFDCCRDIYNGTTTGFTMSNRYAALLEATAVLLHELNHVAWRLGESRAWCCEGFFRHRVQTFLGIEDQTLAGQTSWPCGSSTKNRDGCSLSELQDDMVDIMDAPDPRCET